MGSAQRCTFLRRLPEDPPPIIRLGQFYWAFAMTDRWVAVVQARVLHADEIGGARSILNVNTLKSTKASRVIPGPPTRALIDVRLTCPIGNRLGPEGGRSLRNGLDPRGASLNKSCRIAADPYRTGRWLPCSCTRSNGPRIWPGDASRTR